MKYITELRESNPNEVKNLFERGDQMIKCASLGEFRKFRQLVENYEVSF
jgi:hypothetical protein